MSARRFATPGETATQHELPRALPFAGGARRFAALPSPFPLRAGGVLEDAVVAYETWGRLNRDRSNAILLFTGLSPSAHAASSPEDPSDGWWEPMLGPGKAIDTERWFVVCVNSLGSPFGSTSPLSINPATGYPYRLDFPELSIEDIAAAGHETVRSLGIERLEAVIGPSLGGIVALAFVAQFPGVARRLVSISGTDAASPVAIALRSVQREAIMRDPQWHGGHYAPDRPPRNGMRLARKIGTITYRSSLEWNERFGRAPLGGNTHRASSFAPEFAIEGYLEAHAERFVRNFDANCYLYLSRAMDRFDLAAHAPPAVVFARARLDSALVIGVQSDMLFQLQEQERIAAALIAAQVPTTLVSMPSREGHDAFLVDIPRFDATLRRYLSDTETLNDHAAAP
jgi:homoserine O-acetyltransferase